MARPRAANPFDTFIDAIVEQVASRLMDRVGAITQSAGGGRRGRPAGNGRRVSAMKGRKLDMRCRYPGCKNRSKGPRFRFLCEQHLKLPKREVKAAMEKAGK